MKLDVQLEVILSLLIDCWLVREVDWLSRNIALALNIDNIVPMAVLVSNSINQSESFYERPLYNKVSSLAETRVRAGKSHFLWKLGEVEVVSQRGRCACALYNIYCHDGG